MKNIRSDMFDEKFLKEIENIINRQIAKCFEVQQAPKPMTVDEVAAYIGLNRQTVYRYASKRKIPHSKILNRLYFDKTKIDVWLLSRSVPTIKEIEAKADNYLRNNPR